MNGDLEGTWFDKEMNDCTDLLKTFSLKSSLADCAIFYLIPLV